MSQLPRQEDINVYDSLDERSAVRSFLGKTREDILQRLPGEYESLQEDLAFMGPVAFAYYAPAWEEFCRTRPCARVSQRFGARGFTIGNF